MSMFDFLATRFLPSKSDPKFDYFNLCFGAIAGYTNSKHKLT